MGRHEELRERSFEALTCLIVVLNDHKIPGALQLYRGVQRRNDFIAQLKAYHVSLAFKGCF